VKNQKNRAQGPGSSWRVADQPRSERAARTVRLLVTVPLVVESVLALGGVAAESVVVVVVVLDGSVLLVLLPVPEVDVSVEVVAGVLVIELPVPLVLVLDGGVLALDGSVDGAAGVVLVAAGVLVVVLCVVLWFGSAGEPLVVVVVVPVVVVLVCANDTPIAVRRATAAVAVVRVFGSLDIRISCSRVKNMVSMGCPLQRSSWDKQARQ